MTGTGSPSTAIVEAAERLEAGDEPLALRDGAPLRFPPTPRAERARYAALVAGTRVAGRLRALRGERPSLGASGAPAAGMPALHQTTQTVRPWDAVSNDALAIQDLLRANGYRSELFAEHIDRRLAHRVRPIGELAAPAFAGDPVLAHVCVHAPRVYRVLAAHPGDLHLRFHSNTPASWFAGVSYGFELSARRGWEEMVALSRRTASAIADSAHNADEVRAVGVRDVTEVPILLADAPAPAAWIGGGGYAVSVGRIAPNKRIDFLLRTVAAYQRRFDPGFGLVLVGSDRGLERYAAACQDLERELGVRNVRWVGAVDEAEKQRLMAAADAYLCASDHEGFCVPLVEGFRMGLPVVARATSAVTGTCGEALAVDTDDPSFLAAVLRVVVEDAGLRAGLLEVQAREAERFDPDRVGRQVLDWAARHVTAP